MINFELESPVLFCPLIKVNIALSRYEEAVAASELGDAGASWVQYNVGTACTSGGTEHGGVRMPARDFILASSRMRLDDNEPVYLILSPLGLSVFVLRTGKFRI